MMIESRGKLRNMLMTASATGPLALVILVVILPMTTAQPGFISIDCGSTSNFTDPNTGLEWTTDDGYISSGVNANVTVQASSMIIRQMTTARYFRDKRKKHCYVLPTAENGSYLIRFAFYYGDLEVTPPSGYTFNLSINSNIVSNMSFSAAEKDTSWFVEYMVPSIGTQIDVCVIPVVGIPFISSLELRPLDSNMYLGLVSKSKYLKFRYRYNTCAYATDPWIRYPQDPYDRMWVPYAAPTEATNTEAINTTAKVEIPATLYESPPEVVMQSAWEADDIRIQMPSAENAVEDVRDHIVTLYFAEIGSPIATDLRSIDGFINDKKLFTGFNVTNSAKKLTFNQLPNIDKNGFTEFSLRKNPTLSTLKPLLNAIELNSVADVDLTTTSSGNVAAINDLRKKLNLLDWTGDPCLPVSWDWVNCSSGNPPEITQIHLSGYQLTGIFPTSVAELTSLTDLWLDDNGITGSIPSLTSLTKLQTLHLQNNSLTGNIPADLADIPNLSQLYLSNNELSGPVPDILRTKNGLDFRVDGQRSGNGNKKSGTSAGLIGGVIGAVVGAIVVVGLIVCFCFWRKSRSKTQSHPESTNTGRYGGRKYADPSLGKGSSAKRGSHHVQTTRAFSLAEVEDATNNRRRKIGEGGFGPVFYGQLASGEEVAVKENKDSSGQGLTEFSTEVSLLTRVHHRNLVSLVGYCEEYDKKILIYQFMPNGTLREHLYGRGLENSLDWHTRLDIALNAAKGLEYLHFDCIPKIIHRDVKSSNILLDENLQAKVADFGISKLTPDEKATSGVSTDVRGSAGYLDPEYFATNKITHKSDVYAFGVVLLEIIAGRAPINDRLEMDQWNLVQYACRKLRDGDLEAIADPTLKGEYNIEAMWKLAELAMYCVEPLGANRPDMRQVVRDVAEAISLERPLNIIPWSNPSQTLTGSSQQFPATDGSSSDFPKASPTFQPKAPVSSHPTWSKPTPR